jgi:LPXTG-site transpeptidase (sortase) family protein
MANHMETIKFIVLRSIGNFLLLFSIYGVLATFGPSLFAEVQFRILQARGVTYSVANPEDDPANAPGRRPIELQGPSFADIISGSTEQVIVPPDASFSVVIPKIGASAAVIPNVDPDNPDDFLQALTKGVAHAKGTVFPGLPGNIYLFAHSTDNWWNVGRYNAIFYLLKDIKPGDEIIVFFEGRRYNYVVDHTTVADPSEVSYLVNSQKSGEEQLILQTCWPPGTTWKRLFVIAKPKSGS